MVKITKKSFLEKLQGKQVTLVTAEFTQSNLDDVLKITTENIDMLHSYSGRNTGKFEKTSAGYKRYIASDKNYSYAELSGSKIFTDNKCVYVIFTGYTLYIGDETKARNSVMVLREAA